MSKRCNLCWKCTKEVAYRSHNRYTDCMENEHWLSRTETLYGTEALAKLAESTVCVFGVGGVGGYVVEALARCGVGHFVLVDKDVVSVSNINRQIIALNSTVGQSKVSVMAKRIHDINPSAVVEEHQCFFLPETADTFDFSRYTWVVDAVDTVTAKIEIILRSKAAGVPVISSMGAGNKVNPTRFELTDISKTSVCPLAKAVRVKLRKLGVTKGVPVVYSREEPRLKKRVPASVSFVPSVAGLIIASHVVNSIVADAEAR